MIDAREAAEKALSFFAELMKDRELQGALKGISLEEIEPTEDEAAWAITFSYPIPAADQNPFEKASDAVLRAIPRRRYKVVRIDAGDGHFISMKTP